MSIDKLHLIECKLSVIRECLGGLWGYALSAIRASDIGYLDYILKTAVTTLVSDLEAIEGEESIVLAKEILEFVQYVEIAMDSIKLKVDTKQVLKQAKETSYDRKADEFIKSIDQFIDEMDSD